MSDDAFFDLLPVDVTQPPRVRYQLPPDARWSQWYSLDVPCPYGYVLSLHVEEHVTPEQLKEYMKQFGLSFK